MRLPLILTALSLSMFVGLVACSSTETTTEEKPTDSDKDDAGPTETKEDAGPTEDTDSGTDGTGDSDEVCLEEATRDACMECCAERHEQGSITLTRAIIACACDSASADGACQDECAATVCGAQPTEPDAACDACIKGSIGQGGACSASVGAACQADEDCMAGQYCLADCAAN